MEEIPVGKRPKKHIRAYERVGVLSMTAFIELYRSRQTTSPDIIMFGKPTRLKSQRYELWNRRKGRGRRCVCCGVEALYVALEKHIKQETGQYHFNAYCISEAGYEVMLTKDHILPKSKGGANSQKNYQPMCAHCNNRKGNRLEGEYRIGKSNGPQKEVSNGN